MNIAVIMENLDTKIILDLSNTYTRKDYKKTGNSLKGIISIDDIEVVFSNQVININISKKIQDIVENWPETAKNQICEDINSITTKYVYSIPSKDIIFRLKYDLVMVMTAEY